MSRDPWSALFAYLFPPPSRTDLDARLDAAVAAYRANPTRTNTAELMAAQAAWNKETR